MRAQIVETIRKYDMLGLGETVVLAVSGGVDSMVLMHSFVELSKDFGLTIIVAHLDHARRAESALERELVRQVAKENGFVFEQDFLPKQGNVGNFHAYARQYRYDFFKRVADNHGATKIVTAHHANDHLETIIDHLMKSDRPTSLIGIRPSGRIFGISVIRPFIEIEKDQLYAYAEKFNVSFLEDASNTSDVYMRNRIRHRIVPLMIKERADVLSHIRNLSDDLEQDEAYFNMQIDELLKNVKVIENGYQMSFSWMLSLPASLRRRLVICLIPLISKGAMRGLTDFLVREAASGAFDVGDGIVVQKTYDKILILTSNSKESRLEYEMELRMFVENVSPDGRKIVLNSGFGEKSSKNEAQGTYLCYNGVRMPLKVRGRRPGDRIRLANGYGHAKVKQIMIDAKLPIDERECWPLIVDADDQLVWIPGLKKSPVCLEKPNSSKDLWLEIY